MPIRDRRSPRPKTGQGSPHSSRPLTSTHRERHGSIEIFFRPAIDTLGPLLPTALGTLEPRIAYHHPLLDHKFGIDPDDRLGCVDRRPAGRNLIDHFVRAAGAAREARVSPCRREGVPRLPAARVSSRRRCAGPLRRRFRWTNSFVAEIIQRIRAAWPDLLIVVRLIAFDTVPYRGQLPRPGSRPVAYETLLPYRYGFGLDNNDPLQARSDRDHSAGAAIGGARRGGGQRFVRQSLLQPARPAPGRLSPQRWIYPPPEDPLVGVARQIDATRQIKQAVPELPIVGTGYSYLQDYLPHVAQAVVRENWADLVGLGRMVLSYPELPADVLAHGRLARKRICRTFSDCTTAPRHGIISGCFPLDPYYKSLPEAETLQAIKSRQADARRENRR